MKYGFDIKRTFWQGSSISRGQVKTLADKLANAIAEQTGVRPGITYQRGSFDFYINVQGKGTITLNSRLRIRFKTPNLDLRVSGTELQNFQRSARSAEELSHFLDRQFNYSMLTKIAKEVHGGYDD